PPGYDPDFPEDPQVEFSFQLLSSPAYERLNPRNCVSATIWSDGNESDEPDYELVDLTDYIGDAYWNNQTNIPDPSEQMILRRRIGLYMPPGSYTLQFEVSCLNGDIVGLDDIMLRTQCQHLSVPSELVDAMQNLEFDANESAVTTYDTLSSLKGCDSIVERNWYLGINRWNWVDTLIPESELPFTWNDSVFLTFDQKTTTIAASNGCDSTIEMCLSTYTTHEYSICSGQEYVETGMDTLFLEDFRDPQSVMYGQSWQFAGSSNYRLDGWYPTTSVRGYAGDGIFLASNSPRNPNYWGGLSYAVTPDIEIFDPSRTTLSFRYLQPMQIYVDGIHSYNDLSVAWGKSMDMMNVKWSNSDLCRRCVDISETINPIWTSTSDSYNWRTKTISLDTVMGGWDYYRFAFIDQDWLMFSAIDSVMVYGPTVHRVPDYLWEYYEGADTTIVDTALGGVNQGPHSLLQSSPDILMCPAQYEVNTYHITHAPRNKRFQVMNPSTQEMITAENAPDYLCYTANEYGGHQLFVHSPENVSFTISDLPEGLEVSYSNYNALDNALVSITGTPTQPGQYTVTVEATDRAGMVCFPLTFSFLIDVKASPIYDTMEQTIDLDDVLLPYTWQGAVFNNFGHQDIKTYDRRGCRVYRHLRLNVLAYEEYRVCQGQEYIDFGYDTLFYESFGELRTGGDWQMRSDATYAIDGWRKVDNMRGYSHVLNHPVYEYIPERDMWLNTFVYDKYFLGSNSPRNVDNYGASLYAISNPITIYDPSRTQISFDYIQPRTLVPFNSFNKLSLGWANASDMLPSMSNEQVFGAINTIWNGNEYSYEWRRKVIDLDTTSLIEAGNYMLSFIDKDGMMFSGVDEVLVYGPRYKIIPEEVRNAELGSDIYCKDTLYYSPIDSCYKVTTVHYKVRECIGPEVTIFDTILQGTTLYTHIDTLLYETFDDLEEGGCPDDWLSEPGDGAMGFVAANSLDYSEDFGDDYIFRTSNGEGNAMWEPSLYTTDRSYLISPAFTVTNPARTHFIFKYIMPAFQGADMDDFHAILAENDLPEVSGLGYLVQEESVDVPEWVESDRCIASIPRARYHIKFVHHDMNAWFAAVDDVKVLSIFSKRVPADLSNTTIYFYDTISISETTDRIVRYAVYIKPVESLLDAAAPALDKNPHQEGTAADTHESQPSSTLPTVGQATPIEIIEKKETIEKTEAIEDTARSLGHRDSDGVPVSAAETKDTYSRKENPSVSASLEW
ncbi:MAG: putative Ig domain-containing protein, partial [Bacteroidales bacterium]|nr:putative Ig domain-containing protein [Candidatus Colimorpha onthohippi]